MKKKMPDIAKQDTVKTGTLNWVGMKQVEMPVFIDGSYRTPAKFNLFVNLTDPNAKGIHMSRLYLLVDKAMDHPVTLNGLRDLLNAFVLSHEGVSDSAKIEFTFEHMVKRKALVSENYGWRTYPIHVSCLKTPAGIDFEIGVEVAYSSTCPCSAALARQLIQENFEDKFGDKDLHFDEVHAFFGSQDGIVATPHSQRSYAKIKVKLNVSAEDLYFMKLIDTVEEALKTPVQSAVKREDEQEFARLNGQNTMFCEDAGRIIKDTLNDLHDVRDFWAEVRHVESLHPHDAVSVVTKGVEGGY